MAFGCVDCSTDGRGVSFGSFSCKESCGMIWGPEMSDVIGGAKVWLPPSSTLTPTRPAGVTVVGVRPVVTPVIKVLSCDEDDDGDKWSCGVIVMVGCDIFVVITDVVDDNGGNCVSIDVCCCVGGGAAAKCWSCGSVVVCKSWGCWNIAWGNWDIWMGCAVICGCDCSDGCVSGRGSAVPELIASTSASETSPGSFSSISLFILAFSCSFSLFSTSVLSSVFIGAMGTSCGAEVVVGISFVVVFVGISCGCCGWDGVGSLSLDSEESLL